jgi:predicted XRE-type DNA-binding protein
MTRYPDSTELEIFESCGNIFEDIGYSKSEAASLLLRADLMLAITTELKRRKLTQKQAAALLGVTQPRISHLKNRRIAFFSLDTLVDMLTQLGMSVTITATRARWWRR